MPIILSDIRAAVQAYLNSKVAVSVSAVTPDVPSTLNPGEEATFGVTITNAGFPDGIRLTNVRYRLWTSGTLKLKVPPAALAVARASNSSAAPALAPGTFVSEMYLFPTDSTLDVGDSDAMSGLKIKAGTLGGYSINCRIIADADTNFLFPKDEDSATASRAVSVV